MTESDVVQDEWAAREAAPYEHEPWPMRPLLLALLGLVAGLGVHFVFGGANWWDSKALTPLILAEVAAIVVTAGLIGYTVERRLAWASVLFAVTMGAVAAGTAWWNGDPRGWAGGDGWRMFSLFLGIVIAAPLFQAFRDAAVSHQAGEDAPPFGYRAVHDHAWTNVVLWFACWAFVGISFALVALLAGLFDLIKIHFLRDLLQENWFCRALVGAAFGGALGMLREHDRVVRLLYRVVATVLAVLAPVLAAGLVVFVLALPFTGLEALWKADVPTTPLLLACVVGALVLANAVIGNSAEQERRFPLLKGAAMLLGLVMLPLAVIAAIATGLRIDQYGFTPERLWALTFVVIACAYGLAYLVSLLRARLRWAEKARPANLVLSFFLCALALLLATPLVSFNAISTRDQIARLESGKLTPETFDWRALAFDFGQPGRDALAKLQRSANAAIKRRADEVAKVENRWDMPYGPQPIHAPLEERMRILPQGSTIPAGLRDLVAKEYPCGTSETRCTLILLPGGQEALAMQDNCFAAPTGKPPASRSDVHVVDGEVCGQSTPDRYVLSNGKWASAASIHRDVDTLKREETDAGFRSGQIEVRPVQRRQVFVGGKPVGGAFE